MGHIISPTCCFWMEIMIINHGVLRDKVIILLLGMWVDGLLYMGGTYIYIYMGGTYIYIYTWEVPIYTYIHTHIYIYIVIIEFHFLTIINWSNLRRHLQMLVDRYFS